MSKRTFRLDKLVRTGKFRDMQDQGQEVDRQVLEPDSPEKRAALAAKVREEAAEIDPNSPTFLKEVADTQQALNELAESRGYSPEDVERARKAEQVRWGTFEAGIFVRTVTLDEDSHWAIYYMSHPELFPQVEE